MNGLPDRYRFAARVAATAALPRRARVAARRRALAGFYAQLTRRADAVVAVHPKNGGTWLRTLMFRVMQQKYGLASRRVMKSDELARARPGLPRFVFSNGAYSYERAVAATLDELAAGDQPRSLILMARHPGDVAVSWYHQFTQRISARKRELIAAELAAPVDPERVSQWAFICNPAIGLPALIDWHNDWARRVAGHRHGLIVRYEELRAEPATHLRRVMEHVGESVDDAVIDDAVAFAGADNMRRLEAERYFTNSSLRQKKSANPDTVKVRRAKVGGFRDDVTPEQAETMAQMIAARLDPVFGYESSG